jgi:hypothetical protein
VDRGKAEREAKAVVVALWSTIGSDEFDDMCSELPKDFGPLLDEAVAEAPRSELKDGPIDHASKREGLEDSAHRRIDHMVTVLMNTMHRKDHTLRPPYWCW